MKTKNLIFLIFLALTKNSFCDVYSCEFSATPDIQGCYELAMGFKSNYNRNMLSDKSEDSNESKATCNFIVPTYCININHEDLAGAEKCKVYDIKKGESIEEDCSTCLENICTYRCQGNEDPDCIEKCSTCY